VRVTGSDMLKPYTGLLLSRKAIHMVPGCRHPAGNKTSVSLPGQPQPASFPASVRQGR